MLNRSLSAQRPLYMIPVLPAYLRHGYDVFGLLVLSSGVFVMDVLVHHGHKIVLALPVLRGRQRIRRNPYNRFYAPGVCSSVTVWNHSLDCRFIVVIFKCQDLKYTARCCVSRLKKVSVRPYSEETVLTWPLALTLAKTQVCKSLRL